MNLAVTYFLWFISYSILGWFYETILCSVMQRKFINRGFLNGPYCPIYGSGALLVITLLGRITNPLILFLVSAVVTCALEYLTSYVMEKLFHARWWDYSNRPLNINGRVCLLGAIVFGAFSVLLVLLVHPAVCKLTDKIPLIIRYIMAVVLCLVLLFDCISTVLALSNFQKKIEYIASLLEEKRHSTAEKLRSSAIHNALQRRKSSLADLLSCQQKRIILAFPKLKLHRYNDLLIELREALEKRHKAQDDQKSKKDNGR